MIHGDGPYAAALRTHIHHTGDIEWIAHQTPLRDDGTPDNPEALRFVEALCAQWQHSLVLVSTPLPVGTCAYLEERYPSLTFGIQPETVRAHQSHADFYQTRRLILGTRRPLLRYALTEMLASNMPSKEVVVVTPETAEMFKHAWNGFLALCVQYGNEIGRLSDKWGAEGELVMRIIKATDRELPLLPGDPPSDHLLREVHNLIDLGGTDLIRSLL